MRHQYKEVYACYIYIAGVIFLCFISDVIINS